MPQPDSLIAHVQIFMLLTLVVLSSINIGSKRKEKRSIGWIMAAICAHTLFHISNIYGYTHSFPSILLINQLIGFLFPWLLLKHAKAVSGDTNYSKVYILLIISGLIMAIIVHIDLVLNKEVEEYINRIVEAKDLPLGYILTICFTQVLIGISGYYVYREYRMYKRKVVGSTSNIDKTLLNYLWFFFLFLILGVISALLLNTIFPSQLAHYLLIPTAFFFFFVASATMLNKMPQATLIAHDEVLEDADGREIKKKEIDKTIDYLFDELIEQHFVVDKIYLNANLTIGKAAILMGVPISDLSKYLNTKLKMNFFEFVNGYRIEESKILLKSDKSEHLSMEGIGQKSGFNSRASFYRAFKKHEKCSPGDF